MSVSVSPVNTPLGHVPDDHLNISADFKTYVHDPFHATIVRAT